MFIYFTGANTYSSLFVEFNQSRQSMWGSEARIKNPNSFFFSEAADWTNLVIFNCIYFYITVLIPLRQIWASSFKRPLTPLVYWTEKKDAAGLSFHRNQARSISFQLLGLPVCLNNHLVSFHLFARGSVMQERAANLTVPATDTWHVGALGWFYYFFLIIAFSYLTH